MTKEKDWPEATPTSPQDRTASVWPYCDRVQPSPRISSGSRAEAWKWGFDAGRASGQHEGFADAMRLAWVRFPELRDQIEKLVRENRRTP